MSVVEISTKTKGSPMLERIDDPQIRERVLAAQQFIGAKYSALGTWKKVILAMKGGVSESALVAFSNGSYNANPLNIVAAIEASRALEEERAEKVFTPSWVDTSMAQRIRRAIRQTKLRGELGICTGQSGIGKTSTFARVCTPPDLSSKDESKRVNPLYDPSIVYVGANPTMLNSLYSTLSALLLKLAPTTPTRTQPAYCYDVLRAALTPISKTLLVDESQFISRLGLDTLRRLSEETETPILFSGNDEFYEASGVMRTLDRAHPAAFVQFTSRCGVRDYLRRDQITRSDVELIALQKLDDETLLEETDGQKLRDSLLAVARGDGGFRALRSVLQRSHEKARGGKPNAGQVLDAIAEAGRKRGAL
jgi:DNA transposition AAA+ family ATPase